MTDLTEWVKERRRVHDAATEGPWYKTPNDRIKTRGVQWPEGDDYDIAGCAGNKGAVIETSRARDGDAIVDAHNTLPALLTAVEKVLELHKPDTVYAWAEECTDPSRHEAFTDVRSGDMLCEDEPIGRFCVGCVPENDTTIDLDEYSWPCPTVRAVQSAIEGVINE